MICSAVSVIFDMLTVYTVNHRDTVPDVLNRVLHIIFIGSIAGVMFFVYLYVRMLCDSERKPTVLSFLPLGLSVVSIAVLPMYYEDSPHGNYSQGASVTAAFVFAFMYILLSMFMLIKHRRTIDRKSMNGILIALLSFIAATVLQLFIKPILITSVGTVMINLALFYTVESPDAILIEKLEAERKRADEANKAKTTFLANMSHEIRTPINSVLGMNEMILRESRETATISYAENIQAAGSTLLSLVNDILDFAKVEEGRMEIMPVQYDVSSLINDIVNMTRTKTDENGLELILDIDKDIPYLLFGDEVRIKQCALNLLSNAVKFTDEGSVTMKLSYEKIPETTDKITICFTVIDTGVGIRAEDMVKLFSAFSVSEKDPNRTVGGTGLGLSITRRLLDLMGGKMFVHSDYGSGSEFSFKVPQKGVDTEPVGDYVKRYESAAAPYINRALFTAPDVNILVVDDTEMNLTVIRGLLRRTKVRLDTVTSGKKAIEAASSKHYDIMLIDHMMPEKDGIETLRELKKLPDSYDTVYIALTANAVSGAREMYLDAGFDDYLAKPVDGKHLEETLQRHISKDKLREPDEPETDKIVSMPDWLLKIDEIDTDSGIRYCGGPAAYLETLEVFAEKVKTNADEMERYHQEGDIQNIIIKIHSLKSSSLAIGAKELSVFAEHLESAAKANDNNTLDADTDELIWRYRRLGALLTPILAQKKVTDDKDLPPMTMMQLLEAYASLRERSQSYDLDGALAVIDTLEKYRIPDSEKDRVTKLAAAVRDIDWDEVEVLLR